MAQEPGIQTEGKSCWLARRKRARSPPSTGEKSASLSSTILSGSQSSPMPRVWVTCGLPRTSLPDQTPALFLLYRVVAVGTGPAPRISALISPTPPDGRPSTAGHGVHGPWRLQSTGSQSRTRLRRLGTHTWAPSCHATWVLPSLLWPPTLIPARSVCGHCIPRGHQVTCLLRGEATQKPARAVARETNIPGKSRP